TKKKMSQGDLAEILNVSRQSISKWENNSSIPDLDKIVKMSEIFEISLDELIKGETPVIDINDDINNDSIHIKSENKQSKQPSNMKRLTGIILLCMAFIMVMMSLFLGEIMAGLIFSSPLIACGLICLFCNKNAGLWCSWSIYLLITAYLIWATGITWNVVFLTFIWTPSMNYLRLAIGWVLFVFLIILVFITVKRFSKSCFTSLHSGAMNTAILWISYLCINIGYKYVNQMMFNSIVVDGQIVGDYGMITLSNVVVDCVKLPLITAALISAVRLIRTWKASKITH
ncbi:MAG: helix-turn-helix transcriptional regulator, partial [Erysipelotrichaceae bacterium]|nr:helix-turn-helix transcriptional regulator [Erysipelotrichaceae bacterium]